MTTQNIDAIPRQGIVGMDMTHPFGVYLDGVQVAEYDSESEASEHYNRLAGRNASAAQQQSA